MFDFYFSGEMTLGIISKNQGSGAEGVTWALSVQWALVSRGRVGRNSVGNLWQFSNRNPIASQLQFLVIIITKDNQANYHPTPNFQSILLKYFFG